MPVRVKLKLSSQAASLVTAALVNTGFESEEPELIIPERVAEMLSLTGPSIVSFKAAGGTKTSGIRVDEELNVDLILTDREPVKANAYVTVMPGEDEVIISDGLASKLKIVILDPQAGFWYLSDELGSAHRKSPPPDYW